MNIETYLSEMRAAGYRFYVTMHPLHMKQTVLTMFPDHPQPRFEEVRFIELETWRKTHITAQDLAKAITASTFATPHNQRTVKS